MHSLPADQIDAAIANLPGWAYFEGKLSREYKFGDFSEALGFIVRVGLLAEAAGHHPELFNVYATVRISLSTHDAGGAVTQKDVDLAKAIANLH